jgi:signal peptidase I
MDLRTGTARPAAGIPPGTGRTLAMVAATAWLSMLGGLLFWANAPALVGWQPRLVLSGSMRPGLSPGDVVLVAGVGDPRSLRPGEVVLVADPDLASGSYLHRVVRREAGGVLVTRGDANRDEDYPAVAADRVLGRMRAVVPAIGAPVVWLRDGDWGPLGQVAAVTVLSLGALTLTGRRPSRSPSRACG